MDGGYNSDARSEGGNSACCGECVHLLWVFLAFLLSVEELSVEEKADDSDEEETTEESKTPPRTGPRRTEEEPEVGPELELGAGLELELGATPLLGDPIDPEEEGESWLRS